MTSIQQWEREAVAALRRSRARREQAREQARGRADARWAFAIVAGIVALAFVLRGFVL